MPDSFLYSLDAVVRRRLPFIACRGHAYEIVGQGFDTAQYLVYHYLVITPEVTEQIDEYKSVYTSIWMIADCNERTVRQCIQDFHILYFVMDSQFVQYRTGKCRTGENGISVVKVIEPVD